MQKLHGCAWYLFIWAILGAGAPAESFGRSHPSRQMPLALAVGYIEKGNDSSGHYLPPDASRPHAGPCISPSRAAFSSTVLAFHLRRLRSSSASCLPATRSRRSILGPPALVHGLMLAGNMLLPTHHWPPHARSRHRVHRQPMLAAASLGDRAYRPWQPWWRWPQRPVVELASYLALNLLVTLASIHRLPL